MGIDIKKLVRISDSNQSLSRFSSDELITELIDRGHDAEYLYGDGISDSSNYTQEQYNQMVDFLFECADDLRYAGEPVNTETVMSLFKALFPNVVKNIGEDLIREALRDLRNEVGIRLEDR